MPAEMFPNIRKLKLVWGIEKLLGYFYWEIKEVTVEFALRPTAKWMMSCLETEWQQQFGVLSRAHLSLTDTDWAPYHSATESPSLQIIMLDLVS